MTQQRGSAFGLTTAGLTTTGVSRRTLLKGSLFGAAVVAFGSQVLTACSTGGGAAPAAGGPAVPLPTYVEPVKPPPLLAGNAEGLMDVYGSFPMDGARTVTEPVGDGGEFEFLVMTYGQPAPPVEENAYWQTLNEELNLEIKPVLVPYADFATKFPALVAADDLPPVVSVPVYMNVSRLPELAAAQFTDLSDHLSGDAVKKYPNLAGIQEYAWLNGYLGGRIYGVPKSDPVFGGQMYTKSDLFEAAGVSEHPESFDELTETLAALTDTTAGVYALASPITDFMLQMHGLPNKWSRGSDGTFTSSYEHPDFIPAIEEMAALYAAGYFHPDTATMDKTQRDSLFRASKIAMTYDGNRAFGIIADDRELVFGMMRSFGADGATPTHWTGGGAYAITMLKQTDDAAAIDRFLKVMNWLAAPFGSAESFIASYGAEGSDYTIEDGVAILTEQGQREQDLGFGYIAGGPQILCNPQGAPGVDTAIYEWQESVIPLLTGNPAQHLYSATQNSKGGSLEQAMTDAITAVFLGREQASSLQTAVATWKRNGGDKIAGEYGEADA
ncbi:hypothetical protein AB1046_03755 [Promicromonospora sp. Populi]|uniref:hypothetical protein n=1 Tax=Promicromonospora sp. Populi TaxID=3239420 RepID=UPI0034E285E5